MSYSYQTERKNVFTENGQVMFLAIRDNAKSLIASAGCARMDKIIAGCGGGDSWTMLACVDRLVELGEIVEVKQLVAVAGQFRIFTRYPS